MNEAPRPALSVRNTARHRTQAFALALALVCAAVFAVSCGGTSGVAGQNHACADKIAKATTTNAPVIGLWNCLSPAFQTRLKEVGLGASTDAALSIGVASQTTFLGMDGDQAAYELVLLSGPAQQVGAKNVDLTVWLDSSGKVTNVGIASPAF